MKKIIIPSLALLALLACNSGDSKNDEKEPSPTEEKKETPAAADNNSPEYTEGLQLVAKSDCPTCHRVDDKVTGPSYREIALKYGSEEKSKIVPLLAGKIISGGTGVWGEVPMIPHPSIAQGDAEKMVKYILLLKK